MSKNINWNKQKIDSKRSLLDRYLEKKTKEGILSEEEIYKNRCVIKYLESVLKNDDIIFEDNEIKNIMYLNTNNGVLYYDKINQIKKKKINIF